MFTEFYIVFITFSITVENYNFDNLFLEVACEKNENI